MSYLLHKSQSIRRELSDAGLTNAEIAKIGRLIMSEAILKTEYNEKFDELRKNRMMMSFYKYGPVEENYGKKRKSGKPLVNAVESMELRLKMYKQTGNTEYLADVGNFAMIEFTYPQHPEAHFKATDADKSPGIVGMSIYEIKAMG